MDDTCEMTEDEKMSVTGEDDVEIPTFLEAAKGLKTFQCFIKSVENVPEKIFKSLRQTIIN